MGTIRSGAGNGRVQSASIQRAGNEGAAIANSGHSVPKKAACKNAACKGTAGFVLTVCLGVLIAAAATAQKQEGGKPNVNAFFAMDTGIKDDAHKTAKAQAEMLKELGYDGIGYSGFPGIAEMLAELTPRGLEMFTVYISSEIRADGFGYDKGLKEAAAALRGHNTVIWVPVNAKGFTNSDEAGDAQAVAMMREMADVAPQLRFALYPHTGMWMEKVEDAVRVAKKVERPNVGATFNLCHWLNAGKGRDMKRLLELAAPHLFVVSINGADKDGTDWKTLIQNLDKGTFNVAEFLAALKSVGYAGPIGLQGYGIGGDAHQNLTDSMAAWKGIGFRGSGVGSRVKEGR
jgi:sugar phosphate isomerase/epimerase